MPNLNISRLVIDRVHTDKKITNNTKMNHIMVSFWDHHNSIFIDRAPSKYKDWKFNGILITSYRISLFSPHMDKVIFQLKNVKNNVSSTSYRYWQCSVFLFFFSSFLCQVSRFQGPDQKSNFCKHVLQLKETGN